MNNILENFGSDLNYLKCDGRIKFDQKIGKMKRYIRWKT